MFHVCLVVAMKLVFLSVFLHFLLLLLLLLSFPHPKACESPWAFLSFFLNSKNQKKFTSCIEKLEPEGPTWSSLRHFLRKRIFGKKKANRKIFTRKPNRSPRVVKRRKKKEEIMAGEG